MRTKKQPESKFKPAWSLELDLWEKTYLWVGNYDGPDLSKYGFKYKPMEHVPIDKRYSAMLEHRAAQKSYRATM